MQSQTGELIGQKRERYIKELNENEKVLKNSGF